MKSSLSAGQKKQKEAHRWQAPPIIHVCRLNIIIPTSLVNVKVRMMTRLQRSRTSALSV